VGGTPGGKETGQVKVHRASQPGRAPVSQERTRIPSPPSKEHEARSRLDGFVADVPSRLFLSTSPAETLRGMELRFYV